MTSYNKSKQETRKNLYKHKDNKATLQKRQEQTETIRKQKREQLFQKRRLDTTVTPASNDTSFVASPSQIASYLNLVHSNDATLMLEGTTKIRKILSLENNPPIQQVIDSGVVTKFVEFLKYNNLPSLQFEACWALTNIASGSSNQTHCVVNAGAVPAFRDLLISPHDDVKEQAVWAIGNIAGDSFQCRDFILRLGVMEYLLRNISESPKISMLRNAAWTMSNLCRGKPQPDWSFVSPALPVLARLVHSSDDEILTDVLWAFSYLSDGTNDRIQSIVETGISRRVTELLIHPSYSVQTPALRMIGNIVTGDDTQTQLMINVGILPCLLALMSSNRKTIKKEACWTISNITAGNRTQIQSVIDANIIPKLISLLKPNIEFDVRKEAAWAISNATSSGSPQQIKYLVDCGSIEPMIEFLSSSDSKMILVGLEALENILKCGEREVKITGINSYANLIEEYGGLDKIEELQNHASVDVYEKAVSILETYFSAEEDDENMSPNINAGAFTFGASMHSSAFDF